VLTLSQNLYDQLVDGAFEGDGDKRVNNLIQSSLQQLGCDSDDSAVYESMLLDIATVSYERNAKAVACAWRATDKYAVSKLQQLLDCSLVKLITHFRWEHNDYVVIDKLWVHDVIKSIATGRAHTQNKHCMTRVWLPDQVIAANTCWW
jgi:hypothetical protein